MNAPGNDVMGLLRHTLMQRMSGHKLARIRFFTPTRNFYGALESYSSLAFVDCGTGAGDLPREMRAEGFHVTGVDMFRRDGQDKTVLIQDVTRFPFGANSVALCCRPDHSGWAHELMKRVLAADAYFFYVSKPCNLQGDLGRARYFKCWQDVGKDGESMYLFKPSKKRSAP